MFDLWSKYDDLWPITQPVVWYGCHKIYTDLCLGSVSLAVRSSAVKLGIIFQAFVGISIISNVEQMWTRNNKNELTLVSLIGALGT